MGVDGQRDTVAQRYEFIETIIINSVNKDIRSLEIINIIDIISFVIIENLLKEFPSNLDFIRIFDEILFFDQIKFWVQRNGNRFWRGRFNVCDMLGKHFNIYMILGRDRPIEFYIFISIQLPICGLIFGIIKIRISSRNICNVCN